MLKLLDPPKPWVCPGDLKFLAQIVAGQHTMMKLTWEVAWGFDLSDLASSTTSTSLQWLTTTPSTTSTSSLRSWGSSSESSSSTRAFATPTFSQDQSSHEEDDDEDEAIFMQMTNNEEADLRQLRMSEYQLQRLEQLLTGLDDHQEEGRGPNARWALACVIRRAHHAQDLLELLLRVRHRCLQPRGYWPIVRVPRDRAQAGRLFGWARHFGSVMQQCVEECFQLPPTTSRSRTS